MKIKRIALLIIFFLLFMIPGKTWAEEKQTVQVDMKVNYGFHENVKTGNSVPLVVRFKNQGISFSGRLEIKIPVKPDQTKKVGNLWMGERNSQIYTYEKKVSLEEGEILDETFFLDIPIYDTKVYVLLKDGNHIVSQKALDIHMQKNMSRIFVGIVSDNLEGIDLLENQEISLEKGYNKNVFVKTIPLLPEEIYANEMALRQLDMLIVDEGTIFTKEQEQAIESWREDAGFYLSRNGEPLHLLFKQFIWGPERNNFLSYLEQMQTYDFHDVLNVDLIPVNEKPSIAGYLIVLSLYIFLSGPLLYFWMKKKKKQKFILAGTCIISIVFVVLIRIMASTSIFKAPFISYCGYYRQKDGLWSESYQMGIQAPYRNAFQLYLDNHYRVQALYTGYNGDEIDQENQTENIRIQYQEDNTKVTLDNIPAFTQNYFLMKKVEETDEKNQICINISGEDGYMKGTWKNPTKYRISHGILVLRNRIAILGDMEPYSEGVIESTQLISHGTDSVKIALQERLDFSQYAFPEHEAQYLAEQIENVQRRNRLGISYYVGIVDNPDLKFQKNSGYKIFGTALFYMTLNINWERDGYVWLPNMEVYGEPEDGEFSYNTNLVNSRVTTVDYNIGNLKDVKFIQMFPARYYREKDYIPFQGSVAWYDWKKKSFQVLEDWKEIQGGDALRRYIREDGKMRIRYTLDDSLNGMERTPMLPCIQAVGKVDGDA